MKLVEGVEYELKMKGKRPLPEGWRLVKLGEMCEIIAGQSPPGETYRRSPEGIPFFQGKADFGPRHPIARMWCVAPIKIALSGDILISVRAPVGPTNIADVECCIGRGLAAIRPGSYADRDFILAVLKFSESKLAALGSGSTFDAIKRIDLESLTIPLPPLSEQKRIAAILNEQMSAVEKAGDSAAAQLEAAKLLPTAYLRTIFNSTEAQEWARKRISEVCRLLPSKSISTNGDVEVLAITTACLSETGFQDSGVKRARMNAKDAAECRVSPGEVLVARSNTPELVGRVAMFEGEPKGAVASDLTIRLLPSDAVKPFFLTAYLSFLYLSGYWKERAGGASGSMKKITRHQIQEEQVPIPSLTDQIRVATISKDHIMSVVQLIEALREQLKIIGELPPILFRRAFSGNI